MNDSKVIAFDADDTLWANESFFQSIEADYSRLLAHALPAGEVSKELLKTEIQNLEIYGYGAKSFTLSMIETALRITDNQIEASVIKQIIDLGKSLLNMPIELRPGVEEVLRKLAGKYMLVVATKGDLLDQERKLKRSGVMDYFDHIEIMSDKQQSDYLKLIRSLKCFPHEFLMIGNSLRSDIEPVLSIGGYAGHVPFHVTWAYEESDADINNERFIKLEKITDILTHIQSCEP